MWVASSSTGPLARAERRRRAASAAPRSMGERSARCGTLVRRATRRDPYGPAVCARSAGRGRCGRHPGDRDGGVGAGIDGGVLDRDRGWSRGAPRRGRSPRHRWDDRGARPAGPPDLRHRHRGHASARFDERARDRDRRAPFLTADAAARDEPTSPTSNFALSVHEAFMNDVSPRLPSFAAPASHGAAAGASGRIHVPRALPCALPVRVEERPAARRGHRDGRRRRAGDLLRRASAVRRLRGALVRANVALCDRASGRCGSPEVETSEAGHADGACDARRRRHARPRHRSARDGSSRSGSSGRRTATSSGYRVTRPPASRAASASPATRRTRSLRQRASSTTTSRSRSRRGTRTVHIAATTRRSRRGRDGSRSRRSVATSCPSKRRRRGDDQMAPRATPSFASARSAADDHRALTVAVRR